MLCGLTRFCISQGLIPNTALANQGLKINEGLLSRGISGLSIRLSNKLNEKGLIFNQSSNLGNKKGRYYHTSSAVKMNP